MEHVEGHIYCVPKEKTGFDCLLLTRDVLARSFVPQHRRREEQKQKQSRLLILSESHQTMNDATFFVVIGGKQIPVVQGLLV